MSYFTLARDGNDASVSYNGKPLELRLDLANNSPDGFNWGYLGSGPAQLAVAMLAKVFNDDTAKMFYQQFKIQMIAPVQADRTVITFLDIAEWAFRNEDIRMIVSEFDLGRRAVYVPKHCASVTDKLAELGFIKYVKTDGVLYPKSCIIQYD